MQHLDAISINTNRNTLDGKRHTRDYKAGGPPFHMLFSNNRCRQHVHEEGSDEND